MPRLSDLRPKTAAFFAYQAMEDQAPLLQGAAQAFARAGWKILAVPALRPALGRAAAYAPASALAGRASLIVSLGGDGTLLGASALAAPKGLAVLGVNLGGLGFITAIGPQGLAQKLDALLKGSCRIERRQMVRATLMRRGRRVAQLDALNDLVLARTGVGRMAQLEASVDGRFLAGFRADGLIFSSPTGSTAYNLSVGGPLVDPSTPVLLLSLISPHTLSHRPLVLSASSVLELTLPQGGLQLAADGRSNILLKAGDRLLLQRSPHRVPLVFPLGRDPWAVLRDKLGWQGLSRAIGARRA